MKSGYNNDLHSIYKSACGRRLKSVCVREGEGRGHGIDSKTYESINQRYNNTAQTVSLTRI